MESWTGLRKRSGILRLFLGCVALLCVSLPCTAQRYSFRGYTEGLDNLNVTSLAQDHTGYLWAGTESGLYRYDGVKFTRYGTAEGLPDRVIQNVFVGLDDTLWVATSSGIYYERPNGSFAQVKPPSPANPFFLRIGTTFAARRPDQVVVATQNGAFRLQRVADNNWIAQPMNLEGTDIWSVLYGPDGTLWYGCDADLCRLSNGKTTRLGAALGLPKDEWLHLLRARNGHIWIRGLMHVGELLPAKRQFELHDLPGKSGAQPAEALAEDAQGRIVASRGPSFGTWENGHWRMVTERNGLPRLDISELFVDREGSFWIGVVGHGLVLWLGEDRWQGYTTADGLSDNTVWATVRDHEGRLWIGTPSGLDYIPAGGGEPRAWQSAGIGTGRAVALAVGPDGGIWMGSAIGSVTRIDPHTLAGTQWKTPKVFRILADNGNRLWIATSCGLYVVDLASGNNTPRHVEDPGITHSKQRFTNLSLDPNGTMWATGDRGLYHYDGKGWIRIDPGFSPFKPDVIAVDKQGNLWVAGPSQDLMKLQVSGNRVTQVDRIQRPALLSEQVVALMVDHRGRVWVGQDAGVSIYDGHDWRSFTKDDGLIWNDIDSDALMEDTDGSVWIGTSGGLSHLLKPQTAPFESQSAPVFEHAMYNGSAVDNGSQVRWGDGPLVISMASLSFRDTRDTGIRYRLLGKRGSGWEETHEMTVRYRHLEPGDYRFEVEPVDASGNALSPKSVFTFSIEARWWQNIVVQLSFGLLVVFVVLVIWRWRVDLLMGQKRQLENAVQMRTEDLEQEKAELVRAREQMRHYAEHDGLTGVWNHRIIVQRLCGEVERSRREGRPLSIILVDLDHFKKINDTFGHPAGDEMLKQTGAIFQHLVRSYDWVGRYGGEEFLMVLPGADFASACSRAEVMRKTLQEANIMYGDTRIPITGSFGVVSGYPSEYESMIQAADAALYRAKSRGRNRVVASELDALERAYAARDVTPQ